MLPVEDNRKRAFKVLCLDGGGAKGFYTLGVLKGIEAMIGRPLHETFDLIFGTSTGSIIGALVALGYDVDAIAALYRTHVVKVMSPILPSRKTRALHDLAEDIFRTKQPSDFKTLVGIISTNWDSERPLIFKTRSTQAFGGKENFVPFFGVPISDAIVASCSAYPFFLKKRVETTDGDFVQLFDGGFCANNPTLYAIAEAINALQVDPAMLRVISLGVGEYPAPTKSIINPLKWLSYAISVRVLQKTLEVNTQSMDQLRRLIFKNVPVVRISNAYTSPALATDMFEHDLDKLDLLWRRGRDSFLQYETELRTALM